MTQLMENINSRTQLVGRNRFELLMFSMGDGQRFGINVFKVKEVIKCPKLTRVPKAHHVIRGMANMRGTTITIMDLAKAVGKPAIKDEELSESIVVITEYNRQIQGFLVAKVDRIVNLNWEEIEPPPSGLGNATFLTAVTKVEDKLVEIIDVEKVMGDIMGYSDMIDLSVTDDTKKEKVKGKHVLVIDDSNMAIKQITRVLEQMEIEYTTAKNGRLGYECLLNWLEDSDVPIEQRCALVLSDVEMPEMDGYTLTKHIKEHPELKKLHVLLHSSLSGQFNESMVKKVGADEFIAKYDATELAMRVLEHIQDSSDLSLDKAA